jgi:hypothetical protein
MVNTTSSTCISAQCLLYKCARRKGLLFVEVVCAQKVVVCVAGHRGLLPPGFKNFVVMTRKDENYVARGGKNSTRTAGRYAQVRLEVLE